MLKKIITDPVLYVLLALNAYFIYEYIQHPESYTTIIWLFWCQSVLIGIFNFFELLTTSNVIAGDFRMKDKPVDTNKGRGCYSLFFLVHYGMFHIGYLIFLSVQAGFKNIDPLFFKLSLAILLVNQVFTFFQHKRAYHEHPPSLGLLFFAPYLRIIPMHLTILIPSFLHWKPAVIFLLLKTLMDCLGYLIMRILRTKQTTALPLTANLK